MDLINISQNEYNQFRDKHEHCNFWQSSPMCELKKSQGWQVHYLGLKDENTLLAATALVSMPVLSKYSLFMALRGFMIDYDNLDLVDTFLTKLKEYLHSHNCLYMRTNPYIEYQKHDKNGDVLEGTFKRDSFIQLLDKHGFKHKGFITEFDSTTEPRWMVVLNLVNKDAPTLLKEMDQQTRWSINRSLKYPIQIKTLEKKDFHLFKEMLDRTSVRRGFDSYPLSYFENMSDTFGSDTIEIVMAGLDVHELKTSLTAEKEDYLSQKKDIQAKLEECPNSKKFVKKLKVVDEGIELTNKKLEEANELEKQYGSYFYMAGSMFIWDKNEVIYLLSASDEEFRKFMAPYAIQWKQIQKALEKGLPRYNFYGTSGNFSKDAEDYGVYEFKKGFNADVVELVGDFEYIDRPFLYKTYNFLRQIKHKLKG